MEPDTPKPPIDELVDQLLRDQDFLLAREIRHQVETLNTLLARARQQGLRLEVTTARRDEAEEGAPPAVDIRIFRQI